MTQKCRKELTPSITFQPNKIFVRNDLFEKIIKSCKATNLEFLKLKKKLGLCLYEGICDEKEFILMSEESFTQHDVENKQLKEENKKLNENKNGNENENKIVKDSNIQKLIEEPKEIRSPNWLDKNKFKEILTIIDSNKFGHKNKIGDFKYIDIKDLVNNIKDNTISEIDAKKDLNALNEIKNVEIIKYKKRTPGHKKLLNLFNNLSNIILTDKTLESESQENENEKVESRKEENEKVESRKEENEDEDYENKNENEYDDETMDQKKIKIIIIKNLNDKIK